MVKNQIQWEKFKHPYEEVEEEDKDQDQRPYKDSYEKQERGIGKFIMTPFGAVPVYQSDKHFEFWVGHTNFDLTIGVVQLISQTPGVESLDVYSRYRFRIGIGKFFDELEVRKAIYNRLCNQQNEKKTDAKTVKPDSEKNFHVIKSFLDAKFKYWAMCIKPDNTIDTFGNEQQETVAAKVSEYRAINDAKIITSW